MKFHTELQQMAEQASAIKLEIIAQVLALPDNPEITRLSEAPSAFTLMSSEAFKHDNLSPRHHDFLAQYRAIATKIEETPIEKLSAVLERIVETGAVAMPQGVMRLHPQVVENLKALCNSQSITTQ